MQAPPTTPSHDALFGAPLPLPFRSAKEKPLTLRQVMPLGPPLDHPVIIGLPDECTIGGSTQIVVNTSFTMARMDHEMLYVVFAESTISAAIMGSASTQAFNMPAVLSRLHTMDQASMSMDLRRLMEALHTVCTHEAQYWQASRLQYRLHDVRLQRYQTFTILCDMWRCRPELYVFVQVPCHLTQSRIFSVPVCGRVLAPYMTPNMNELYMWFDYYQDWEHHRKSILVVKLKDMTLHGVCPKHAIEVPHEGTLPTLVDQTETEDRAHGHLG